MSETLIVALLVILSFIPGFEAKNKLEASLESKIKVELKTEEKNTEEINIAKVPEKANYSEISAGARAAYFIDKNSGEVIFEKNKSAKLPMASTTKLMTALIAVEKLDLNEVVIVPTPLETRPLDSTVGLASGDKIKVIELLHGLLIESGSDTALTLSRRIAGNERAFAALMNEKKSIFGLTGTQFTNSVGYDDSGHYSTAEDLAKLGRLALSNKTIAEIVAKRSYTLKTENGKRFYLTNTNKLVGASYKGLKTGTTYAAGECLITYFNDGEREIIGVVLQSPDRFGETSAIVEWAKKAFSWE